MLEKIDIYDVVTSLLHGTLFLVAGLVLFPQIAKVSHPLGSSEFLSSIAFISIAYFVGQVITSLSSMIQPFLFLTWGGMPSKLAFQGSIPDKYLSCDMAELARSTIQKTASMPLSDAAIFSKATGIARKAEGSLVERHNRMYAYNRAAFCNLLLISSLFALSCRYGLCKSYSFLQIVGMAIGFLLLLLLHWYRAKQRAFYFVREILVVAERELSGGV